MRGKSWLLDTNSQSDGLIVWIVSGSTACPVSLFMSAASFVLMSATRLSRAWCCKI
ncbi:hypothetical protein BDZ91DRAFT_723295, partial [Kalaharituber pfeilii]